MKIAFSSSNYGVACWTTNNFWRHPRHCSSKEHVPSLFSSWSQILSSSIFNSLKRLHCAKYHNSWLTCKNWQINPTKYNFMLEFNYDSCQKKETNKSTLYWLISVIRHIFLSYIKLKLIYFNECNKKDNIKPGINTGKTDWSLTSGFQTVRNSWLGILWLNRFESRMTPKEAAPGILKNTIFLRENTSKFLPQSLKFDRFVTCFLQVGFTLIWLLFNILFSCVTLYGFPVPWVY